MVPHNNAMKNFVTFVIRVDEEFSEYWGDFNLLRLNLALTYQSPTSLQLFDLHCYWECRKKTSILSQLFSSWELTVRVGSVTSRWIRCVAVAPCSSHLRRPPASLSGHIMVALMLLLRKRPLRYSNPVGPYCKRSLFQTLSLSCFSCNGTPFAPLQGCISSLFAKSELKLLIAHKLNGEPHYSGYIAEKPDEYLRLAVFADVFTKLEGNRWVTTVLLSNTCINTGVILDLWCFKSHSHSWSRISKGIRQISNLL